MMKANKSELYVNADGIRMELHFGIFNTTWRITLHGDDIDEMEKMIETYRAMQKKV